jgi:hypothetical protein
MALVKCCKQLILQISEMLSSNSSVNKVCHVRENHPKEVIDLFLNSGPIQSPLLLFDEVEKSIFIDFI